MVSLTHPTRELHRPAVSLRKDSLDQKLAQFRVALTGRESHDVSLSNYALYRAFGGPTIDYRKPGDTSPSPQEIREKFEAFVEANES